MSKRQRRTNRSVGSPAKESWQKACPEVPPACGTSLTTIATTSSARRKSCVAAPTAGGGVSTTGVQQPLALAEGSGPRSRNESRDFFPQHLPQQPRSPAGPVSEQFGQALALAATRRPPTLSSFMHTQDATGRAARSVRGTRAHTTLCRRRLLSQRLFSAAFTGGGPLGGRGITT